MTKLSHYYHRYSDGCKSEDKKMMIIAVGAEIRRCLNTNKYN